MDIAAGLLEAARELAAEAGLRIDYRLGDAERLPFEDAAFDAVISTFGVMFAADQEAAARELARVCRPGGRIALAAWQPGSAAEAMRAVMAPFMPPAHSPAPPPPFNWGDPDWLARTLGDSFAIACEEGTTVYRLRDAEAV